MVKALIAAVPVVCLIVMEHDLVAEGWRPWRSAWHNGIFLALLAGAAFWVRHFLWRPSRWRIALAILSLAVGWKVVRAEWIVRTDYEHMGNFGKDTYVPDSSPLWSPPTPGDKVPGATSWREWQYFYIGGAGGPIAEPVLGLNWTITLLKITCVTVVGYLLSWLPKLRPWRRFPTARPSPLWKFKVR